MTSNMVIDDSIYKTAPFDSLNNNLSLQINPISSASPPPPLLSPSLIRAILFLKLFSLFVVSTEIVLYKIATLLGLLHSFVSESYIAVSFITPLEAL